MSSSMKTGPALLALIAAAACSGETDQTNTTVMVDNEQQTANMAEPDPANPFAQSEGEMNERMMAAVGANAAETWVRKMIEHHRGGVAMSEALIAAGGRPQVLAMARKTIDDQRKDIEKLEAMLQEGVTGPTPANPYEASEKKMHQAMMGAMGSDPSDTWIRKMIEHHRGGIEMSNILIAQGGDPAALEMARTTIAKQGREIDELEKMAGQAANGAEATNTM